MSRSGRLRLFLVAAAALAFLLVYGLTGLPAFGNYQGPYGIVVAHIAVGERKATDVVNAVTFDYRGLDTMGEEFILFTSSIGLVVLLREQRDERREEEGEQEDREEPHESQEKQPSHGQAGERPGQGRGDDEPAADRRHRETSPALRALGLCLVGPMLVLGVYIASHGQLTPGGGFQGGVVLAAAVVLVYVTGGYLAIARMRPTASMELAEALGAGGYVALGLGGLLAGARFLTNFLPLGTKGSLLSSGTIASLSVVVGLEVAGAFTLIVSEFVDQRLLTATRPRSS